MPPLPIEQALPDASGPLRFPAIIREEMRILNEPVPDRLDTPLVDNQVIQLRADSFLFTTPAGTRFCYRQGQGIAISQGREGSAEETDLFYNGTVYGAVAWLNGLIPLHASSVVSDGRVIAFTGQSGEGKSTLAAALAQHGVSHRSDDVLLIEMRDDGIYAWPDRDRIKLCADAFELTGAARLEPIEPGADKFFADLGNISKAGPLSGDGLPLPLCELVFIHSAENGPPKLESLVGSQKFPALTNALYRIEIAIGLANQQAHRAILLRLARGLRCWNLFRVRSRRSFANDVALIADLLTEL